MGWNEGQSERHGPERRPNPLSELVTQSRTRRIVRYLLDGPPSPVNLASVVAFVDRHEPPDGSAHDASRRERIAIDLHHNRLPKLSAADLIEYDPASRTLVDGIDRREERLLRELFSDGSNRTRDGAGAVE